MNLTLYTIRHVMNDITMMGPKALGRRAFQSVEGSSDPVTGLGTANYTVLFDLVIVFTSRGNVVAIDGLMSMVEQENWKIR
jgi:hypothetical protein